MTDQTSPDNKSNEKVLIGGLDLVGITVDGAKLSPLHASSVWEEWPPNTWPEDIKPVKIPASKFLQVSMSVNGVQFYAEGSSLIAGLRNEIRELIEEKKNDEADNRELEAGLIEEREGRTKAERERSILIGDNRILSTLLEELLTEKAFRG